jgi:hypothetical protein
MKESATMPAGQPNVLIILADDLGWSDTFRDFPPRQASADFDPQAMLDSVLSAAAGGGGSR